MAYDGMYGDLSTRGTTNEILTEVLEVQTEVNLSEANVVALAAQTIDSAALAQGSADTALINAGLASNAATNAVNAQDAAVAAQVAAEAAANSAASKTAGFITPKASNPTVRDDGSSLQQGDRYYNTTNNLEYIYNGSIWEPNESSAQLLAYENQVASDSGSGLVGYNLNVTNSFPALVAQKFAEKVSVVDFMTTAQKNDFFAQTGLVDQSTALNNFWQHIKTTFVDVSSEDFVKRCGEVPAGLYRCDFPVNWTNLKARNTIIKADGAVFYGRGITTNVVDITGTRWIQIQGLTIFGDETNPPRCGLLLGPQVAETSGNNVLYGVNVTGHFTKTAIWNIGSETTAWIRSRAANYSLDPAAKVYIGDGRMRWGATSSFSALRAAGVGVSFTNNQFYSCDMRHMGGGAPMQLEFTRGWGFDRGCYFISFNDAIFELYTSSTSVHQNLSIEGLMESTFTDTPTPGNTGCKHQIKFIGDGTASTLEGFTFKVGIPHTALSSFKIDTAGTVALTNADILIGHQLTPGVPIFDAPGLSISGRIQGAKADEFNFDQIAKFDGSIVMAGTGIRLPAAGTYTYVASTQNQLILGGSGPYTTSAGVYRVMGSATDLPIKLRSKGAGRVELGNENFTTALTVEAAVGDINSCTVKSSLTSPTYTVTSASATLDVNLKSKGSGSKVILGNDNAANTWVEVSGVSTFPTVQAGGSGANIDLTLAGKGTGNVRFGTLTANADAPITGYITIKDAGGVVRKLAVIT